MVRKFDFLVIGSGIAGMSFALKVAHKGTVALICKAGLEEANTYFAQGGIASVTNLAVDNFDKHIEDTMIAGDWISDRAAVEKVVRNAPGQISELIKWGVNFDKKDNGEFDLHKEGGHSEFRILHHKDNTGAEIQESLIEAVKQHPNITVFTNFFAVEIITQHHLGIIVTRYTPGIKCYGAYVLNENTGEVDTFLSKVTIMATGGCEAVYRNTTNPLVATGDGIAMVYRAKGAVKDMEFIQFHPTALYHPGDRPCFLITEAMRGYGGVLRTMDGKEFMQKYATYFNEGWSGMDSSAMRDLFLSKGASMWYESTGQCLQYLTDENQELLDDIAWFKLPLLDGYDATDETMYFANSGKAIFMSKAFVEENKEEIYRFVEYFINHFGDIYLYEYNTCSGIMPSNMDNLSNLYKELYKEFNAVTEYAACWDVIIDPVSNEVLKGEIYNLTLGEITPQEFAEIMDQAIEENVK